RRALAPVVYGRLRAPHPRHHDLSRNEQAASGLPRVRPGPRSRHRPLRSGRRRPGTAEEAGGPEPRRVENGEPRGSRGNVSAAQGQGRSHQRLGPHRLDRRLFLGSRRERPRGLTRAAPQRGAPREAVFGTGRQGPVPWSVGRGHPAVAAGVRAGVIRRRQVLTATYAGEPDIVRLLLDRGAHPGDTRAPSTETWLSFAFSWTAGPIDRCGLAPSR